MDFVVFYFLDCIELPLVPSGEPASDSEVSKTLFDDFGSSGCSQIREKIKTVFSLHSVPRFKLQYLSKVVPCGKIPSC